MATRIRTAADLHTRLTKLKAEKDPNRKVVSICAGTGCCAYGSITNLIGPLSVPIPPE